MTGRINKTLGLLIGAYLLVFLQSHWQGPRLWLGFQPDLTPALLVCAGLSDAADAFSDKGLETVSMADFEAAVVKALQS